MKQQDTTKPLLISCSKMKTGNLVLAQKWVENIGLNDADNNSIAITCVVYGGKRFITITSMQNWAITEQKLVQLPSDAESKNLRRILIGYCQVDKLIDNNQLLIPDLLLDLLGWTKQEKVICFLWKNRVDIFLKSELLQELRDKQNCSTYWDFSLLYLDKWYLHHLLCPETPFCLVEQYRDYPTLIHNEIGTPCEF